MISPLATLETVLRALFRPKNQSEIPEPEFAPFDLSYLKERPRETGRPDFAEPGPVTVYPPPVPFNYPQS